MKNVPRYLLAISLNGEALNERGEDKKHLLKMKSEGM